MSGREITKARRVAQLNLSDSPVEHGCTKSGNPFTRYYCIQVEGREKFPYGIAGPFRSSDDAETARDVLGGILLGQGHSEFTLGIYECGWFDEVENLPWDERFSTYISAPVAVARASSHGWAAA